MMLLLEVVFNICWPESNACHILLVIKNYSVIWVKDKLPSFFLEFTTLLHKEFYPAVICIQSYHSPTHPAIYKAIHTTLCHSLTHSLTHPWTLHTLTWSPSLPPHLPTLHSITHTHPPTHSFTHSLTVPPMETFVYSLALTHSPPLWVIKWIC